MINDTIINLFDPMEILVISINLLLMIFAQRILSIVYHEPESSPGFKRRVLIFRGLNIVIIIAFTLAHIYLAGSSRNIGYNIVSITVVLYLSYIALHLLHYWVRSHYGRQREVEGVSQLVDTYNSRLINIFVSIFIFVIALVSIIRILGFDGLLEAGGAIGLIGVFLALTQATWAPDMFSGLIILNSRMMEVGDVIEFNDGEKCLGIVYKTKIFHTEILNLINNHRIMIRNGKLREQTIHNLSKFASSRGLRERLLFKIDYAEEPEAIHKLFQTAHQAAVEQGISLESQYPVEVAVHETGDYAVEWACFYYTKDVKNLVRTRQQFREQVLIASRAQGISLATPILASNMISQAGGASAP